MVRLLVSSGMDDCLLLPQVRMNFKKNLLSGSINGSVSDLLVEGTRGFVHSLKPQEVNLS